MLETLVDTDGDGEGDTLVVENTDAVSSCGIGAYKNATGLFIDNDGVDGIPEEADAKQLALVTSNFKIYVTPEIKRHVQIWQWVDNK